MDARPHVPRYDVIDYDKLPDLSHLTRFHAGRCAIFIDMRQGIVDSTACKLYAETKYCIWQKSVDVQTDKTYRSGYIEFTRPMAGDYARRCIGQGNIILMRVPKDIPRHIRKEKVTNIKYRIGGPWEIGDDSASKPGRRVHKEKIKNNTLLISPLSTSIPMTLTSQSSIHTAIKSNRSIPGATIETVHATVPEVKTTLEPTLPEVKTTLEPTLPEVKVNSTPRRSQTTIEESTVCDRLAAELKGKREVNTIVGRIDVLTSSEIIEVKRWRLWKHALGQLMAYHKCFPSRRMRAHFYGKHPRSFPAAVAIMIALGIRVTEYDSDWKVRDIKPQDLTGMHVSTTTHIPTVIPTSSQQSESLAAAVKVAQMTDSKITIEVDLRRN